MMWVSMRTFAWAKLLARLECLPWRGEEQTTIVQLLIVIG